MLRFCLPALLLTMQAAFAAAPAPDPQIVSGGVALVFGNSTYPGLPPLPACMASAHAVSAALSRLNIIVVEQEDASAGVMDAALSSFSAEIRKRVAPAAIIYACGYGTAFDQRSFLLPVSAAISRPGDVLTQGVLTRSVLATVEQAHAGASLAVLDVVPLPKAPTDLGLAGLARSNLPPQLGLLAASETPPGMTPTPLANALIDALHAPQPVTVQGVLQAMQAAITGETAVHVAAVHDVAVPVTPIARPAAAEPKPAPPVATPTPASTSPTAAEPPTPAAAPPPAAAAPASLPDEDHMTGSDRRQVQSSLARLGYYDGKVDGIFGPDTRAAIRRWQHELHAPMTGRLTAVEADRLAGS